MPPVTENRKTPGQLQSKTPVDSPPPRPKSVFEDEETKGKEGRSCLTQDADSADRSAVSAYFKTEPCLYSHRVFQRAAKIFEDIRQSQGSPESRGQVVHRRRAASLWGRVQCSLPELEFRDPQERKLSFELALATTMYYEVFKEILEDSEFFKNREQLEDEEALVMVILWDYQSRKFQPRKLKVPETLSDDISLIEKAILDHQVKLQATIARRRIKASAPNIKHLLPEKIRQKSISQKPMPVYAWINTLKSSPEEVMETLKASGFSRLDKPPQSRAEFGEKSFFVDQHCFDVLVFSADCCDMLETHQLLKEGHLVRQDKSSCLAAHSMVPLTREDKDVMVVNPGQGWMVAHLAVLLRDNQGSVVVISEQDDYEYNKMLGNIELVCGTTSNLKFIRNTFTLLDSQDVRLKRVRAALVIADCSKSAINNILQYIVTEGEYVKVLQKLSDQYTDTDVQLTELQADHLSCLRHTLKFPKVRAVAYITRSLYTEENVEVVENSVQYVNDFQDSQPLVPRPQSWVVIAPVLTFTSQEISEGSVVCGKYVCFHRSEMMNGCFLACIAREPKELDVTIAHVRPKALLSKITKVKAKSTTTHTEKLISARLSGKALKPRKSLVSTSIYNAEVEAQRAANVRLTLVRVPEHHKVIFHPGPFR